MFLRIQLCIRFCSSRKKSMMSIVSLLSWIGKSGLIQAPGVSKCASILPAIAWRGQAFLF
jgi:hypothetical protein